MKNLDYQAHIVIYVKFPPMMESFSETCCNIWSLLIFIILTLIIGNVKKKIRGKKQNCGRECRTWYSTGCKYSHILQIERRVTELALHSCPVNKLMCIVTGFSAVAFLKTKQGKTIEDHLQLLKTKQHQRKNVCLQSYRVKITKTKKVCNQWIGQTDYAVAV